MIVRRFMQWVSTASAADRATGAGALAQAFLTSDMDADERDEAEIALTALLDDPSPKVRKALADVLGASAGAPHAIIVALANDQSDIAAGVLRYSPLLSDSELIDCAAIGDAFAQASIALRAVVSPPVAAALAEVGRREALVALAVNPDAGIPEFSLRRIVARFGADAELREALLSREHLPAVVRSDLVAATARSLSAFVEARAWMSPERAGRVVRDSCDRAHLIIAADTDAATGWQGAKALATHLRQSGQLTPSLILRAILSGNTTLFEASLIELSDLPERKAVGLLRQPRAAGLATVYRSAAMPEGLLPAFQAATIARAEAPGQHDAKLSRAMIASVLRACEAHGAGEMNALLALLRRFEAEAAREEARTVVDEMRTPPATLLGGPDAFTPKARKEPRLIEIDLVRLEADLAA